MVILTSYVQGMTHDKEIKIHICVCPSQMQGQSPPAPIRFTKKAAAEEEGDEGEEQEEDGGGGQDIMDLLPRTDIG